MRSSVLHNQAHIHYFIITTPSISLCKVGSHDPVLFTLVNHSSSTDDSTDATVVTERGRMKTKSKKGKTERMKRSVSPESGNYNVYMISI